jgi:predicted PurR-regulated permease PerM
MDAAIRIGLITLLVIMCWSIFKPFANLMVWALILAIALYPLHRRFARRLGNRQGRAATLIVLAGLLLIGGPTVMLGSSFATHVHNGYTALEEQTVTIPSPPATVAEWPLVGKRIFKAWDAAAHNLPVFLQANAEQVKSVSRWGLSAAASTAGSVLMFLGALIFAGIMMAYGEAGSAAMRRILNGFAGAAKGPHLQRLTTATVRSVATGVIGVAFIQALLLGVGFIMAGVPAAGLLALVVMLLGIVQLPAALISLPVIAWLWVSGDASTTSNIVFSIYLLVAGLADNVLKPLLLGRGVDAPMPVILLGAMGGMVGAGIIGLFVGAVLLAVGYQLFMEWIDFREQEASAAADTAEPGQTASAESGAAGG